MNEQEYNDIDYDLIFSGPDEDSISMPSPLPYTDTAKRDITTTETNTEKAELPHNPIRIDFPEAGTEYCGGTCDGSIYQSIFLGKDGAASYAMIKAFLNEEGYGDIPLPKDFEELLKFKIPTRNRQILLFEDNGYAHNPIKILFPKSGKSTRKLTLLIYNEKAENHLLRFHNKEC